MFNYYDIRLTLDKKGVEARAFIQYRSHTDFIISIFTVK